jgi:MinD-like ATPase involved in chromosome partitioning or flagellar assembly
MIELGIIDLSAEGRRRVAALIDKWSWASPDSRASTPQCSVTLLSPEEVRFNGSCDVYLIGPELINCDVAFIATLRKQLPSKLIVCVLDARTYAFSVVEQLGRLGVDDVLIDSATSDEFFRRLVLLQRRIQNRQKGALSIVSGGRGGVGVTFIAAALSEAFLMLGRSVCVVDCDAYSQDLTRSLKIMPHVSEPLQLLLEQQRVMTSESVLECAVPVWEGESAFHCVPPPTGGDPATFCTAKAARTFISFLDALRVHFDEVVVDAATLPASSVHALYQSAHRVIFVANRDPSGAFANRRALSVVGSYLQPDAEVAIILNDNSVAAASPSLLTREVLTVPGRSVSPLIIPKTPRAAQWACTGATPYRFFVRSFNALTTQLGHEETPVKSSGFERGRKWVNGLMSGLCTGRLRRSTKKEWAEVNRLEGVTSGGHDIRYPVVVSGSSSSVEEGKLVSKPMLIA